MWLQYDENLGENKFLKDIITNHPDIIKKVSEENWIICVPRVGVFESEATIDVILDHICIHGQNEKYCTLSKKTVVVKNKKIYIDTGYQQSEIAILFEEIFYINKYSKYTVWCVDEPLFNKYEYCDSHKTRILEDISDCIDFLWSESLGHGFLNDINKLVQKFVQEHPELGTESLQTTKEAVGALFSQCLQKGLSRSVIKNKSMKNTIFLDNFKISVEMYMQYCLGKCLIYAVNTIQYQSDAFLNKLILNSVDIDLSDIGISPEFFDVVTLAKRELCKINSYYTVLDKINCLKRTFNSIYTNSEDLKIQITSDIILELLVYLILKLKINNWISNITLMKEFRLSLIDDTDQCSYFITNLEAAIEFIKSNHFLDIRHKKKIADSSYGLVNLFSEKILSDELNLKLMIHCHNSSKSNFNLCHPLCSCEKCLESFDTEIPLESQVIGKEDENLLFNAVKLGVCDVVEYLLKERNYDVNVRDCSNKTCLHYAAAKGYQDILLLTIMCNANVNVVDNDKNTPLHLACMNGHDNCVKALIYSSPLVELNIGNNFGETPLHFATKWGFLDIIKILLENGASLLIENIHKQTVNSMASNLYTLRLFQRYGSKHNEKWCKEFNNCILVDKQEKNLVGKCKEHGIRPKDMEQYKKIDLLLKAIESNDSPLACFYLGFTDYSATISQKKSCHPLCRCEKCNYENDIDIKSNNVSQHYFNVNMCNVNGYTPLHVAAKYGRTDILRLLLDSGALPNVKTYKTLYTPLHLACIFKRTQTIRELFKSGNCKIDESDAVGNTPLFYAVANNDLKIVEILVSNGADCLKKNYANKSPLQESEEKMYYRIFKVLKYGLTNSLKSSEYLNKKKQNLDLI